MNTPAIITLLGSPLLGLILLSSCSINPVTGDRELSLISEKQEISIGQENYVPSQQSQGGPYVADPKLTAYVKNVGMKLVKVSDRPDLPFDFVVINNPTPNAWALPGGKIAVNRGLLTQLHNEAELAAVLSHEIVHAAARHSAKSMERDLLLKAGSRGLGVALGGKENADLIVGAATLGTALISQKYSREAESEADKFGMQYMTRAGYDPAAAVTLQETFVKLAQNKQSNWLDGLFASHPPSQERVEANKETVEQLNAKGVLREKEYQAAIAHLIKSKTAYVKYQQGQKALNDRKHSEALKLAQQAITIEPNEALFYGMKGDALASADKLREAEKAYATALKKNPDFFYFYLQRGLVREKLKQPKLAQQDLVASTKLLPTAVAFNNLGDLQLQAGNKDRAIESFKIASSSKSIAGQRAGVSLARLELPIHPEKYIEAKPLLTQNSTVGVALINHSPVTVTRASVDVAIVNIYNNILQKRSMQTRDTIAPGGQIVLDTKMFLPGRSTTSNVRTRITYAEATAETR